MNLYFHQLSRIVNLRMKKIILILLFYFCQYVELAPTYVTLTIPRHRSKRDAENLWEISIPLSNGPMKKLSLKRTDGLLISSDTDVWYARRADDSDKIIYTPGTMPKELGRIDFYHDFAQKASVVVYHDLQIIEGFIGFDRFELKTDDLNVDDDQKKKYRLVQQPQSFDSHVPGIPTGEKLPSNIPPWTQNIPRDQPPTNVYPQLLIQLDDEEVRIDLMGTLRKMIMYWNAVDMLYSTFVQPRIQLNIAGLILPMDNKSAPWLEVVNPGGLHEYVNLSEILNVMVKHFHRYKDIFLPESYDVKLAFTRYRLEEEGIVGGQAVLNPSCYAYFQSIILRSSEIEYNNGAHELAHSFSAGHHQDEEECKNFKGIMSGEVYRGESEYLEWSSCARKSIQSYFSNKSSECFDNYPRIKPVEIPVEVTEPVVEPHCFSHFYFPDEICQNATSLSYAGENEMCQDIICSKHLANEKNNPMQKNIILTQIPNGLACEYDRFGVFSACYHGKCLPIDETSTREDSLKCLLLEEEEQ